MSMWRTITPRSSGEHWSAGVDWSSQGQGGCSLRIIYALAESLGPGLWPSHPWHTSGQPPGHYFQDIEVMFILSRFKRACFIPNLASTWRSWVFVKRDQSPEQKLSNRTRPWTGTKVWPENGSGIQPPPPLLKCTQIKSWLLIPLHMSGKMPPETLLKPWLLLKCRNMKRELMCCFCE